MCAVQGLALEGRSWVGTARAGGLFAFPILWHAAYGFCRSRLPASTSPIICPIPAPFAEGSVVVHEHLALEEEDIAYHGLSHIAYHGLSLSVFKGHAAVGWTQSCEYQVF